MLLTTHPVSLYPRSRRAVWSSSTHHSPRQPVHLHLHTLPNVTCNRREHTVCCRASTAPSSPPAAGTHASVHGAGGSNSNSSTSGAPEVEQVLALALGNEATFVEMTLRGRPGPASTAGAGPPAWRLVTIRPVLLKGKRQLQFSFFDGRQTLVKNFAPEDALVQLSSVLKLCLSSVQLRTTQEEFNIQISRKGKPIIHRSSVRAAAGPSGGMSDSTDSEGPALAGTRQLISLQHDRAKQLPISPREPHVFLQKLGMQTADGRIKSDMQDKFTQVNEFLKLLGHTGALERWAADRGTTEAAPSQPADEGAAATDQMRDRRASSIGASSSSDSGSSGSVISDRKEAVCILDCGCGSSHLTFGTFHYLNHVLRLPARIMGIDTNAALMQRSNVYSRELGLTEDQAQFYTSPILGFVHKAPAAPDVVLALHACDTATDEALALGIKQRASVILAVPCCHKHLHRLLAKSAPPVPFGPLMRHGILKQRQLDMLTDTYRAQLLRMFGYKTDAVEFTSAEHTPRNLLLRAVKLPAAADGSSNGSSPDGEVGGPAAEGAGSSRQQQVLRDLVAEYDELKAFWGNVTPHLEVLLADEMQQLRARLTLGE